jgi:hypothetical protein
MTTLIARFRSASSWLVAFALFGAGSASAETLMMPDRDTLTGINTVVWGVTTQANGSAYTIDFGDGTSANGNVADRSYIAFDHTYALAGTYTATLTIGGESDTVDIDVYNPASLSAIDLRGVDVNRAIEDGLRYLWVNQTDRAINFPDSVTTNWSGIAGYNGPAAGLGTLAFLNHGYSLPNNDNAPTGLYEKYIVRRGLNQVLDLLETWNLDEQPAGNPCVGSGSGPDPDGAGPALCVGLYINQDSNNAGQFQFSHSSYETPFAAMALAASGTPNRTVAEIAGTNSGGYVVGKTYGEILQRIVNAIAWGQQDVGQNANGVGGWYYSLNYGSASDGSTVGWVMIGLLDAEASGATIPAFVRSEWGGVGKALENAINDDGSFDYQSNSNPASNSSVNIAKTGVGLQGMYFANRPLAAAAPQNSLDFISAGWDNVNPPGVFQSFVCRNNTYNKGCGNVFKAFRLYGVETLPGVGRPAGPGTIPENDWYADYVDWLLDNQTAPTSQTGGNWAEAAQNDLYFSSQTSNEPAEAALALLILSPVVLVQPDPETFSQVGLKQGTPLSIDPDTNPVGTQHTVVARAESAGGVPIPGVTISFRVTGRNTASGSGQSDANGEVSFSYTDTGDQDSDGQDTIEAFIGQIGSNIASNVLEKNWQAAAGLVCDVDIDGDVDYDDLIAIRGKNGQLAAAGDIFDPNGDRRINVADMRYCLLRLTRN